MKDGVYLGEDVDQAHAQGLIDQLNAIHYPKPQTNPIKIKAYDDGKSQDVVEEKLVVKYKGSLSLILLSKLFIFHLLYILPK